MELVGYLDVLARLDFTGIPAILSNNLFLVGDILDPMDVLSPASSHLTFDGVWGEASKNQDRGAPAGGVVDSGAKTLRSNINVDNDALRFVCEPVSHQHEQESAEAGGMLTAHSHQPWRALPSRRCTVSEVGALQRR